MTTNILDDSVFTAEDLHKLVGLFRARISHVMQAITDVRLEYKATNHLAPEELSPIMIRAQNDFSELLKLSDTCWQAREGEIELREAMNQATVVFDELFIFFEWLQGVRIERFFVNSADFDIVEQIRETFSVGLQKV